MPTCITDHAGFLGQAWGFTWGWESQAALPPFAYMEKQSKTPPSAEPATLSSLIVAL